MSIGTSHSSTVGDLEEEKKEVAERAARRRKELVKVTAAEREAANSLMECEFD